MESNNKSFAKEHDMTININDDNVISANDTAAITNHFVTVDVKYNYKGGVFYHKGTTEVHVFNCDDDDVRNNGCKITKQLAIDYVRSEHVGYGQFTEIAYAAEVTEICYAG